MATCEHAPYPLPYTLLCLLCRPGTVAYLPWHAARCTAGGGRGFRSRRTQGWGDGVGYCIARVAALRGSDEEGESGWRACDFGILHTGFRALRFRLEPCAACRDATEAAPKRKRDMISDLWKKVTGS